LNRVEIHCAAGNTKSAAIPRRLGFTLEGTIREGQFLNGRYHDTLLFSMLKREWVQLQRSATALPGG
jgi:ribosomal-protein-serine acetyltransferase